MSLFIQKRHRFVLKPRDLKSILFFIYLHGMSGHVELRQSNISKKLDVSPLKIIATAVTVSMTD